MTTQIVITFIFGVTFIVTLIIIAIAFPKPTSFQYSVFRIVLSLAAAGVAAMVPGFINVEISSTVGLIVRAGGALAVFVIVFFFNPAHLAVNIEETDKTSLPVAPDQLPNGTPFPADMQEPFVKVWRLLAALEQDGENLWKHVSDQTLSVFADRFHEAEKCIAEHGLFFTEEDYEALKEILRAADFYLGGKVTLSNIRNGTINGDIIKLDLAGPGERNRYVDNAVQLQIRQNKRWLTRYRNLLNKIRSSFHKKITR